MADDDFDGEDGNDDASEWPTAFYRRHVLSQLRQLKQVVDRVEKKTDERIDSLKKELRENYVTKEIFELIVGPIKKIGWLIFTVVTSALVMGVLGLLFASGKIGK